MQEEEVSVVVCRPFWRIAGRGRPWKILSVVTALRLEVGESRESIDADKDETVQEEEVSVVVGRPKWHSPGSDASNLWHSPRSDAWHSTRSESWHSPRSDAVGFWHSAGLDASKSLFSMLGSSGHWSDDEDN